jgi:hypothetical protein
MGGWVRWGAEGEERREKKETDKTYTPLLHSPAEGKRPSGTIGVGLNCVVISDS